MSNNNFTKKYMQDLKDHIVDSLKSINDNYEYILSWNSDIEKRKASNNTRMDFQDNEIFIVLTSNPSRSYGDGDLTWNLELTCMCAQKDLENVFEILTQYANGTIQNKWWTDEGVLVNEHWFTPTIQENFIDYNITKGALISMSGNIAFTQNIVDVDSVYLMNEKTKLLEFFKTTTAVTQNNVSVNSSHNKGINKSILIKIDLKIKNTNSIFSNICRAIANNEISMNTEISCKIVYTDGYEENYNMIVNSSILNCANGAIPTLTASLIEKF